MAREMKDSGIEWIGEIPAEWKVAMLKRIASIQTGSTPAKSEENIYYSTEKGIPWIKAENLGTNLSIKETTEYLTDDGAKEGRVFEPNTVYVCCIASVGKVGYSELTASCNQQINALCFKNFNWKYGYYMSCSQEMEYLLNASGNVMKIINSDKQSSIMCPVPPLSEQEKIAAHLDSECAKIDDVITKTKATIEEYKRLKQSVITEAVTKGIRPNREMKDSGIEWIGEIPREWQIQKLKYCCNTRNTKYDESYGNIPYFALENIVSWNGQFINTDSKYDVSQSIICKKGDIVFGKLRPYLAKVYCVKENSCCSSEFAVFHNFSGITRFFYHILLSYWFINIVDASTYGTKMPRANVDFVNNMIIPVPQEVEQQEIADYLDKKCSEIDNLMAKKEQIITELESYKKSLIYEYVTGKKEVL